MKWLTSGLLLLYPVLVLLGVSQWSPRLVGLVVIAVYLIHAWGKCRCFWQQLLLLAIASTAAGVLWWANDALVLQLVPSGISLAMAGYFAHGILVPPSLPGRMAAMQHRMPYSALDPRIQRYTQSVTGVWCLFLLANAGVAAALAVYASPVWWALYTGLLAYLAIALLFAIEYAYRRLVFYRQHGL
ncbi:hypothetical protein [Marinimicrobium sp. ARAG 43.8]|uniref:hypothetical protein n=1 Tax=Marinimicrobium sp. ARAG 43.8 TaxID=3418719 RepID=UPI003CE73831